MEKFTLKFSQEEGFSSGEISLSRSFIKGLKDNGLLKRVTPKFIDDFFPESFQAEIVIIGKQVYFFLDLEKIRLGAIPAYLNRDIQADDDKIYFKIPVHKIPHSQNVEEIVLDFASGLS